MDYSILIVGWFLYFTVHSILASNQLKILTERRLPMLYKFYRIIYNFIAFFGLFALAYCTLQDKNFLFTPTLLTKILASLLMLSGIIVLIIAFRTFNLKEFFGIEQYQQIENPKLIVTGIYHYVRHPLYTGTILLILGIFLYLPNYAVLIFGCIALLYIEIGSSLEEKKLGIVFGQDYASYCRKVKKYFLFVY